MDRYMKDSYPNLHINLKMKPNMLNKNDKL